MQDSPDDRASDVPGRATGEDASDRSRPQAEGGTERDVDDVAWRIARIRRVLGQAAFMLDSPSGDRRA